MSRNEILEVYNLRQKEAGEPIINDNELNIKKTHEFFAQPNGYWQFGTAPQVKVFDFINNYVKSKNGNVTIKEIIDEAEKNGYIYPESTYRAYIQKICFQSKEDKNLFIHKEYLNYYPDIPLIGKKNYGVANWIAKTGVAILTDNNNELEYTSFIDLLHKKGIAEKMIGSRSNLISYIVDFASDKFDLWEINEKIKINEDKLSELDLNKIGFKTEPEYKSIIRALIIKHLKSNKGAEESKNNLFKLFSDRMPQNLKKNNFYKILNDDEYFFINDNNNVQLSIDLLPEPEYLNLQTQSVVDNYQFENKPIAELPQRFSREIFDWDKLKPKLSLMLREWEYSFDDKEIEMGLEIMYKKMIENNDSRFSRVFQSLYELNFYKTDDFDRETFLLWITLAYEPFLKRFWREEKSTTGLYEVISSIDPIKDLSGYKHLCKTLPREDIDSRKKRFSNYLDTLKHFRKKYSHDIDNSDLNLSMFKQVQTISHFLAVYVYTALILGENSF